MWLVTFRHRRFCEEYARSVSYRDARRFQIITVVLAFLPVLALTPVLVPVLELSIKVASLDRWSDWAWVSDRWFWTGAVVAGAILWLANWKALYRLVRRIMP